MKSIWRRAASRLGKCTGLAITIAVLLFVVHETNAQTSNAQISGLVTDSSGAVVPGAEITAQNTATNVPYTAVSNGAGIYVLQELLPGPYMVTVSAPGFGIVRQSGLMLMTGARMSQNFTLKPGAVEQSVTVTAAQNLISSDDAASASVLDNADDYGSCRS